jgi:hypothetical protein
MRAARTLTLGASRLDLSRDAGEVYAAEIV